MCGSIILYLSVDSLLSFMLLRFKTPWILELKRAFNTPIHPKQTQKLNNPQTASQLDNAFSTCRINKQLPTYYKLAVLINIQPYDVTHFFRSWSITVFTYLSQFSSNNCLYISFSIPAFRFVSSTVSFLYKLHFLNCRALCVIQTIFLNGDDVRKFLNVFHNLLVFCWQRRDQWKISVWVCPRTRNKHEYLQKIAV